jgi:hypothetical protein
MDFKPGREGLMVAGIMRFVYVSTFSAPLMAMLCQLIGLYQLK